MLELLDNKGTATVHSRLEAHIENGCLLSILANAFSIFAYSSLQVSLNGAKKTRLLLPSIGAQQQGDGYQLQALCGAPEDRQAQNALRTAAIAKTCSHWLESGVEVRSLLGPVLQNIFHISTPAGAATAGVRGTRTFVSAKRISRPKVRPPEP